MQTVDMRAMEQRIELDKQLRAIRQLKIQSVAVECDCGFEFIPMKKFYSVKSGETHCECGSCGEKVEL